MQPAEVGAGGQTIGVEVDAVQAGWSLLIVEKGLHQTTFQVVDVQCDKAGPRQVEADRGRGVERIGVVLAQVARGLASGGMTGGAGEFSPFADYDQRADALWLGSALEAAYGEWPAAVREANGGGVDVVISDFLAANGRVLWFQRTEVASS